MSPAVPLPRALRRLLALVALACILPAAAQPRYRFDATPTLLPKTVVPSRVVLRLDLDPAADSFAGEVEIDVNVRRAVASITLHARELEPVRLALATGTQTRPLQLVPSPLADGWQLQPVDGRPVPAGRHRLQLQYRGKVQSRGEGLYAVGYRAPAGPARMLATQFEAIYARSMMPSFDEPVFRTVFEVEVKAPAGYEVLSNTERVQALAEGNVVRHRFAPTPPMQSYLLAVSVGQFDSLEDSVDGIPLRIFTAPGKREQARFAMDATRELLPWFARYFGQPYSLRKLDQLAVPGVRGGAMEDWGLISYNEATLLVDPLRTAPGSTRFIYLIVAHELAHQWFGNLVSPASWNEIWLNEAFATWMANKATAHFRPEWQMPLQRRRWLQGTMETDALPATRAIRSGPVEEARVQDVFDDITYLKGGAVLSMLEQWLGEDVFRRALASYMAERAMRPATAGDLWRHMERASGKPVARVAARWTDAAGLPLVTASQRCVGGATQVTLARSRLQLLQPQREVAWEIPVRLARGAEVRTVLLGRQARVRFPGCDERPVVANAGGAGYYRVDFDEGMRRRLAAALPTLPAADQLTLLSDSYAMALAGRRTLGEHFELVQSLPLAQGPGRPTLYLLALDQWADLAQALHGTPAADTLRAMAVALFEPELQRLGWQPQPGESGDAGQLRGELVRRLARLDHAPTLAAARERCGAALAADEAKVTRSLRAAVLYACGRGGGEAEREALLQAVRAAPGVQERMVLLRAAGASPDAAHLRRLIDQVVSGALPPDLGAPVARLATEHEALVPQLYEHVIAHWEPLMKTASVPSRVHVLPGLAQAAGSPALVQRMLADQARLVGVAGRSEAERAEVVVRLRTQLREREAERLAGQARDWAPRLP